MKRCGIKVFALRWKSYLEENEEILSSFFYKKSKLLFDFLNLNEVARVLLCYHALWRKSTRVSVCELLSNIINFSKSVSTQLRRLHLPALQELVLALRRDSIRAHEASSCDARL